MKAGNYIAGFCNSIWLSLRRTLQRSIILLALGPHPLIPLRSEREARQGIFISYGSDK